jgi:hypothetical protein
LGDILRIIVIAQNAVDDGKDFGLIAFDDLLNAISSLAWTRRTRTASSDVR